MSNDKIRVVTLEDNGGVLDVIMKDKDVTREHLMTSISHLWFLNYECSKFQERFGHLFSKEENYILESLSKTTNFWFLLEQHDIVVILQIELYYNHALMSSPVLTFFGKDADGSLYLHKWQNLEAPIKYLKLAPVVIEALKDSYSAACAEISKLMTKVQEKQGNVQKTKSTRKTQKALSRK
jgi:hypothetical protein